MQVSFCWLILGGVFWFSLIDYLTYCEEILIKGEFLLVLPLSKMWDEINGCLLLNFGLVCCWGGCLSNNLRHYSSA